MQEKLSWKQLNEDVQASEGLRLLLIDVDPVHGKIERALVQTLETLSLAPNTFLYLVSDNPPSFWLPILEHGNVGLVCENGIFIRHPMALRVTLSSDVPSRRVSEMQHLNDWIQLVEPGGDDTWRARLLPLIKQQISHIPGASLGDQERMIVCSFEAGDGEQSAWQATELASILEKAVGSASVRVEVKGNQVQVRSAIIDRTTAFRRIVADIENTTGSKLGFCLGLDLDDPLLQAVTELVPHVCPISLGKRASLARFYIDSALEIAQLRL